MWTDDKGLSDFFKLGDLLGEDETLVLIGVSNDVKERFPSKIVCVPKTETKSELCFWYGIADMVVSLSKAETFGMTIAESMACGTPAIVYDNTALPEVITTDTGIVVCNNDVEEVYKGIQHIKSKGHGYYAASCRSKAQKDFDKTICFESYIRLYEQLYQTVQS